LFDIKAAHDGNVIAVDLIHVYDWRQIHEIARDLTVLSYPVGIIANVSRKIQAVARACDTVNAIAHATNSRAKGDSGLRIT
jgi:hypothetical protein